MRPQLYIGTSGWLYKHWNKDFFPATVKPKSWLPYLSTVFNTVELNTTFYHFARGSSYEKWSSSVPKQFLFASKANRVFTHFKRLNLNDSDWDSFRFSMQTLYKLGSNTGPVLFQCPPNLKCDIPLLADFLSGVRQSRLKITYAIEFREESWFNDKAFDLIARNGFIFVISDSPEWPTQTVKTSDDLYLRFHGKPKIFASRYRKSALSKWADELLNLKAKRIYAYFNNDGNANAPKNALFFRSELERRLE